MDNNSLKVELLDVDRLVKVNNLQQITSPIFFVRDGIPSSDGLLSNEIFGITKQQRSNIFAYIDLGDWFIHPYLYKLWKKLDRNIALVVHGVETFSIDENGFLVKDPKGGTGINFLKKNIDKIKIRDTDSAERRVNKKVFDTNRNLLFLNKCIVIPPYYRDIDTKTAGKVAVGEINKLYNSIIISSKALKDAADYGLSLANSTRGRLQDGLLDIYEWFSNEPNLFKKKGTIRRAMMSKTTDYASRLVLSAPNLKVNSVDDLMVDLDHSAIPLASLCSNLKIQIVFWIRRYFDNLFSGNGMIPYKNPKTQKIEFVEVDDPMVQFSDSAIEHEMNLFIKSYANRFSPVLVKLKNGKTINLAFKGRGTSVEDIDKTTSTDKGSTIDYTRHLTWCDLLFMAATEAAKGKYALITRFPMDSYFNQFPTGIRVSSTIKTIPVVVGTEKYRYYPYITQEMIGTDTSTMFIDTLNICNLFLKAIGGDKLKRS